MSERVPQLTDDVLMEVKLRPETEEWADDLLREADFTVCRDANALVVRRVVGGNTNGLSCLSSMLDDMEEALREGNVDPMEFSVCVAAMEPTDE